MKKMEINIEMVIKQLGIEKKQFECWKKKNVTLHKKEEY